MEEESEAYQAAQILSIPVGGARALPDAPVTRSKANTPVNIPFIKREKRKGDLQKEVDTSCLLSSKRPIYRHQCHTKKAFTFLNQLRRDHLLCDVVLVADDQEFPAHKAVLSACSPYFFTMFTCELSESTSSKVTLQEIDGNALKQLIEFVYTSEIQITEDNVQVILPAANLLQLSEVKDACCDFLQTQLHPSNCLGILAFADLHNCKALTSCATQYTEQHFKEVRNHDEFLNLPRQQVIKLLSSDTLVVSDESQVYEAAVSWVKHDLEKRSQYLSHLMEYIRLPLVKKEFFITVEQEELIHTDPKCKDYLIEALKFHLFEADKAFSSSRTRPRLPVSLPKVLLVMGGQAPKAIKGVEVYDFADESWSVVSEMLSRRCRAGVAVHNNLVYVCGGFNGSLRVRTVDVYDPVRDLWSSVQPMELRRSTLGAAVLDGLIYAVGGFDGSIGLASAECYDPKTNEWREISSMSARRSSVGVGVIKGLLYAVGGYDGASRQCLASVEAYNSKTDSWSLVADMSCRRSGPGVAVLNGLLYAVGGHDGPLVRKSVEVYNPELNIWTQLSDMHLCRRNAGVVSHNNMLYVIGGDDGSLHLNSVECYDPSSNTWTIINVHMSVGRSYAGVAIVDKNRW